MPSFVHEQAIRLLKTHPEVLRELCSWLGIPQPGHEDLLHPEHPELRIDIGTAEGVRQLRPDLFVRERNEKPVAETEVSALVLPKPSAPERTVLTAKDPIPEWLALWLIDVQASKDETRADSWIVYVVNIAYFFKIEPTFIIVALGQAMERWCRRQIRNHERLRHEKNVRVLGPSTLAGKNPANAHVAALKALVYREDAPLKLVEQVVRTLQERGDPDDIDFIRMVLMIADPKVAKKVMAKMPQQYDMGEIERKSYFYLHGLSDGEAKGREEGREEGRRDGMVCALFTVLHARGIELSEPVKAALVDCQDLELLERLVGLAGRVAHGEELLAELPMQA